VKTARVAEKWLAWKKPRGRHVMCSCIWQAPTERIDSSYNIDIIILETIAAPSRQLGKRDAALDLLIPAKMETFCRPCPSKGETLLLSIDREEVMGRIYRIPWLEWMQGWEPAE